MPSKPVSNREGQPRIAYVSGANVMQNFKDNIFAKTTAEMDLMARYIDQYCLEHPADSVVVATDKLVKELIAR